MLNCGRGIVFGSFGVVIIKERSIFRRAAYHPPSREVDSSIECRRRGFDIRGDAQSAHEELLSKLGANDRTHPVTIALNESSTFECVGVSRSADRNRWSAANTVGLCARFMIHSHLEFAEHHWSNAA